MTAGPEADAGGVGIGIKVTGQHDVTFALANQLLENSRSSDSLKLALILEVQLPVGQVVDKQQWPERLWGEHLRYEGGAGEVRRSRREVQVKLAHLSRRPAAGNRNSLSCLHVARSPGLTAHLVGDVEVGAE